MRLICCHIENFGGLQNYDLEFDAGLTVIREENGFGKTTLAEFIRAMFYGLPQKGRKNAKIMGKREKYDPWQGGKYGGNLTFEHEGKQYRVERTFGATPKADTFALLDLQTGQRSKAFSEELGQELFGLDAESFERSTYLPQSRDGSPLSTDSIQAKLGGLVEDENDVGGYEKAIKKLEKKRRDYGSDTRGSVAEAIRKILETTQALNRAEDAAVDLVTTEKEIRRLEEKQEEINRRIEDVRSQLTTANEAAARLAHHQQLDRLQQAYGKTARTLDELKAQYPKGIPNQEELEALTDIVERMTGLPSSPVTPEDQEAQRYVKENQIRFGGGVPTEQEIAGMRQICDTYRTLSAQVDACSLSPGDQAELDQTRSFLAPGVPCEEDLSRHAAALEEVQRLRQENLRLAATPGVTPQDKKSTPVVPVLMGLGGVAVLAGIVLFVMNMTALGGIALGLGLVALVAAVYLSMRSAMNRQITALDPRIQTIIQENDARAGELEGSVRAFVAPYGSSLNEIREKNGRLRSLEQRERDLAQRREQLTEEMNDCNDSLRTFFDRYLPQGYSGGGYDLLARIQRDSDTWLRSQEQLRSLDERVERHQQESREIRQVLDRIWTVYALAPRSRDQVLRLRDDARQMGYLEKDARLLEQQIREYREEHAHTLAEPVTGDALDPAELRQRERQLLDAQRDQSAELLRRKQEQEKLSDLAEQIPQLRDQLAHWKEQKEADENRARILDDTMAFLAQAKTDLALAYMGPIRESFAKLMGRMNGEDAGKILVTPDLVVSLERSGESRKLEYFSAGQTDLVTLCMRLALVDALFRETKPFVILDDPFVNLDDRRTAEALELLKELSEERQIIYLTCHSSRT